MQRFRMDRGLLASFVGFLLTMAAAVFLLTFELKPETRVSVSAELGQMRLAFWYPKTSAPLSLGGEWLGFPDQLLSPEAVRRNLSNSVPTRFPDIWQPPKPRRHVMTYTLLLKRIPADTPLGLKLPEIKNSFRLFVDDREVASGGFPSDSSEQSRGYFGDRIIPLGVLPPESRLTLQVSNFGHSRGGVHHAPILASEQHWLQDYRLNILVECVVIALALIAGCLILLEFYLVPDRRELLWIALFSLVLAGYIGSTGMGGFATLIPGFPWPLAVRLEYLGYIATLPLFLNWLAALYRRDISQRLVRWISVTAALLSASVVLMPSPLFTAMLYLFLGFLCFCLLVSLYVMLRLVLKKRSGIRLLVFGALAFMAGILHELAIFMDLLPEPGYLGVGVLLFLISQIGFLTVYRTQEQLRILDLNADLKLSTAELDALITQRSREAEQCDAMLEHEREACQRLLRHDDLTGLMNRHHFLDRVNRRMKRLRGGCCSLIVVDIDHYKHLVDQYGRDYAEKLLVQVADQLQVLCQGCFERIPARYGGDEFILWLGRSDKQEAETLAREIRRAVSRIELPEENGASGQKQYLRVSTGVACSDDFSANLERMLARAADAVHQNRHQHNRNVSGRATGASAAYCGDKLC